LHWCWRNTKKRPKHLAWNISKSWLRPFLSHVMVFFMLNQCRILYFTIIIRENSLHVTSCFGVEEIPKKRAKHLAWNISKSWWRPFLSHVMVFFMFIRVEYSFLKLLKEKIRYMCYGIFHVESVKNTLFYNNYKRKLTTCDKLLWCWRNTKKTTQTSSQKYFQIVVETFPITCNGIFHVESV
jgi:hypothetical protein